MKEKKHKNIDLDKIERSCSTILDIIESSSMEETDKEMTKEEFAFIYKKLQELDKK